MPRYNLLMLKGDGIGPEVMDQALKVLKVIAEASDLMFEINFAPFGGESIDLYGEPLTDEVLDMARKCDAVFLGAVGGPKWDDQVPENRPEAGLLKLRQELDVFANLRPARFFNNLLAACPLKPERSKGADLLMVRELTGGIYFGKPRGIRNKTGPLEGFNTMIYTRAEIERIAHIAFQAARKRDKRLLSVDKANVLESSRVWRQVMDDVAKNYQDVELSHGYIDSVAMSFVTHPTKFDVVVTSNLFGDILSDISAALTGSLGMLPSASLGEGTALYEPVHGSAPDISGQNKANPFGAILSIAMFLEATVDRPDLANLINSSVEQVLSEGYRTGDLYSGASYENLVGTEEIGEITKDKVLSNLKQLGNQEEAPVLN